MQDASKKASVMLLSFAPRGPSHLGMSGGDGDGGGDGGTRRATRRNASENESISH
jgi:hypothetical protein